MAVPVPPPPRETLGKGDLEIIACQRVVDPAVIQGRVFGVRWALRPDLGFPNVFLVDRVIGGVAHKVNQFSLPVTDDWGSFAHDVRNRRPLAGPYFPLHEITEPNLGYLLPIIRLVDRRTPSSEQSSLTTRAAEFFGNLHADDAQLRIELWPDGVVPDLADLLADPARSPRIVSWYQTRCVGFLYALALRFEYAVLLGLATDDLVVEDGGKVIYRVTPNWEGPRGSAESEEKKTNAVCAPVAPKDFQATRTPGSVAHPAFKYFGSWSPPSEALSVDSNGTQQTAESWIPRAPSHITALEWGAAPPSGTLLTYEPVLYLLKRHDHGSATAGNPAPPPEPAPNLFDPIFEGELLMRSEEPPQALDRPGMPWPPMEGYYHYQLCGITLLGVSTAPAVTVLRHYDDLPPAPPGVRLIDEQIVNFPSDLATVNLRLGITWNAAHDFLGPDASEFRVYTRWLPRIAVPVRVETVTPDAGSDHTGTAVIASLQGAANRLSGMRLIVPDGEYPIVEHQSGVHATMRVRRLAGRLPAPGQDGVIFAPDSVSKPQRIARVPRRPAVPVFVSEVQSLDPLRLKLDSATSVPVPAGENFSIYLHLLRTSFTAISEANGVWRIDVPDDDDVRADAWIQWLQLSDPQKLLTDSPAILFPEHAVTLTLQRPAAFRAGLLMLDVTAADATAYVTSGALQGNESAPSTATLSARLVTPPPAPAIQPNERYIWAKSAAVYAEDAYYDLSWPAVNGAAHYEVARVLEGALTGVTAKTDGRTLRSLAKQQQDKFALRSAKVFAPRYRDFLPGRAPTRALYRMRAIDVGGTPGTWSEPFGPVYVPDVRPPAAPNLRAATVPPARPDDPAASERRVVLEWTQSGPLDDIRFDIEIKDRDSDDWIVAGVKLRGTLPTAGTSRSYRHEVTDLIPGEKRFFRVRAVREARDPIDPLGQIRRDVAGPPSDVREGRALGTLVAPDTASATAFNDAAGPAIRLSWINRDRYVAIEILRKGPGEAYFRRTATLDGDVEELIDAGVTGGEWQYRLRALGYSRKAESEELGATAP